MNKQARLFENTGYVFFLLHDYITNFAMFNIMWKKFYVIPFLNKVQQQLLENFIWNILKTNKKPLNF